MMKRLTGKTRSEQVGRAVSALVGGADAAEPLAELGFHDPATAARLLQPLIAYPDLLNKLLALLATDVSPDAALVGLIRLAESRRPADPAAEIASFPHPLLKRLATAMGASQFMADLLVRHSNNLDWLRIQKIGEARTVETFLAEFSRAVSGIREPEARRVESIHCHRRELMRLALRRLMKHSDELGMARELSDLASATLQWAINELMPAIVARHGEPLIEHEKGCVPFAIIGMGKLGGRELNFSSDIDLLFVYGAEGNTRGRADGSHAVTNHEFFTRLAEELLAYLMNPTDEGSFYRVDMRLRPEGASGPLVRSIDGYEFYYETQAHPWERLALLKARPVAGDADLGRRFSAMTRPLIYDPLHKGRLVQKMRELKQSIDHVVATRDAAHREIKRGTGGIREIEFLVQTQQMLHGEGQPALWAQSTIEALSALANAGLIPTAQARQEAEDYVFLRTVEHRLQMTNLRQTHMLPADPRELGLLAGRCGIASGDKLMERWNAISARVHKAFTEFFMAVDDSAARDAPSARAAALILSGEPEATVLPHLAAFGLASPSALKMLRRLSGLGRHYLTLEGRRAWAQILPRLLELARANPQPEIALANFESFLVASGSLAGYYEILLRNGPLFDLLFLAMGSGNVLARTMIAHPELFDYLYEPTEISRGADEPALRERLERWSATADSDDAFARGLSRFKRFEHLMSGLGKLGNFISFETFNARLCLTAELVVRAVLKRAASEMGLGAEPRGFAVLAMGKLGAREFNQFTDLDLIFVCDESFAAGTPSPAETAASLGERVMALLTLTTKEGRPYEVDARLRPEGASAPLVPPLGRYLDYFRQRAQIWEMQSIMKLRPIAGDLELAGRLMAGVRERIVSRLETVDLAAEIRSMRARMEQSRKIPRWVSLDFKTGRGGIVDLEFIAQFIQLSGLARDPGLMGLGPLAVFLRSAERGTRGAESTQNEKPILLEPSVAEQLRDDYTWLRRLEDRTRLLFESDRSWIPEAGEKLEALERACRPLLAGSARSLTDHVTAVLIRNRRQFEAILG
ncbi:bifunctional [glutamate--ammonia ligase]-adenylyl-L-tyrosine phosphorylase/[glutamate--ammonia-ligase] adenylyltransferase [bacterium]|nr:bifunctional [glutamate--ammonia ligase]-adenylyl-L-tyrosine phosphorylase/[glutamate--ammonia-ligase] adenylyltransferase [bacterium]